MTTINSTTGAKFVELEQAIRANQHEFQTMQTQFTTLEQRMLETMETCHLNAKQMLTMQGQMNSMQINVQDIVTQMKIITEHLSSSMSNTIDVQSAHMKSPEKKKQRHQHETSPPITQTNTLPINALTTVLFPNTQPAVQGAQYTSPGTTPDLAREK